MIPSKKLGKRKGAQKKDDLIQAQKMFSSSRHITGSVSTQPPLFSGLMLLAARIVRVRNLKAGSR
jgi:hypothetical protein